MLFKKVPLRYLNIRSWKLSVSNESKKKIIPHGIFLFNFLWIDCKSSYLYLWLNNNRLIGKGVFSRSEPLFLSPNPCYNSVGKAGREKIKFKKNKINYLVSETLQVGILELLYYSKKICIYNQIKIDRFSIKSIISKLDLNFFSIFLQFRDLIFRLLDLRSGIKFSGNFLIYKKKKLLDFHDHSKGILSNEIRSYKNISCIFCHNYDIHLMDLQNRTRLATQVSKFSIFSFDDFYSKLNKIKKLGSFFNREIGIKRFIIN
jgi:hypothetical protein